jgi:hypothetical protein
MKFLLLAYGDEARCKKLSEAEGAALFTQCKRLDEELKATGRLVQGESLEWAARTIRPKNGKPVVTEGPFTEAREIVGGLVIIEAKDLDEATELAKLHPAATLGEELGFGVEVRPIGTCHLP